MFIHIFKKIYALKFNGFKSKKIEIYVEFQFIDRCLNYLQFDVEIMISFLLIKSNDFLKNHVFRVFKSVALRQTISQ
jgi:hypothetical protein